MAIANTLTVKCINKLKAADVRAASFVVYLLKSPKGAYVGETKDLVTRWNHHNNSASVSYRDRGCNLKLKDALKQGGFVVYIVATAKTKEEARVKEALAIEYYKPDLNDRVELIKENLDFSFNRVELISDVVTLRAKRDHGNNDKYSDSDRSTVICRIVLEGGRKRVLCCEGPNSGLYVECSRSDRDRFNVNDVVKIKAVQANRSGRTHLVAAKTSTLTKVSK